MKITPELLTKAYTRGIQSALKGLATDGSDLHENYTPPAICDMMLDKLDLTQPKSILVLYNLELLFALRLRKYTGPVTFFTQSPTKAEIAPKFLPGVAVEYIDKEENPLYFMENKWPEKFDIVVANPPYSSNLDLKFLIRAYDLSKGQICFVHPGTFLVENKGKYSLFQQARKKVFPDLVSSKLFNGNGIFGIGLFVPCSITLVDKNRKSNLVHIQNLIYGKDFLVERGNLDKMSLFGFENNWISFVEKIRSKMDIEGAKSLHSEGCVNMKGKGLRNQNSYFVEFTRICGRGHRGNLPINHKLHKDDFFTLISPQQLVVKKGKNPKYDIWFEFETEKEGKNFLKYLQTDFVRSCLAITKFAQSLNSGEMKLIPWMDFKEEWNDEKLYAHFNITEEEQAFIKEVIPPYYD